MHQGPACCTIVAKNYLSFARVLAGSFHRHHPGIPFFVLLADEIDGHFDPTREPFRLLHWPDLDIPHVERFRFHYAQQPLSYAVTPYLLAGLLKLGFARVGGGGRRVVAGWTAAFPLARWKSCGSS